MKVLRPVGLIISWPLALYQPRQDAGPGPLLRPPAGQVRVPVPTRKPAGLSAAGQFRLLVEDLRPCRPARPRSRFRAIPGPPTDTTAVMNYIESMNTLSGHCDPADEAEASSDNTNPPDFTHGACSTASGSAPA
jgi:hypothetical protein